MRHGFPAMSTFRIVRLKEVCDLIGLSRSSVLRLSQRAESDFPRKISLGLHAVGWLEADVRAWVEARRNATPPVQRQSAPAAVPANSPAQTAPAGGQNGNR